MTDVLTGKKVIKIQREKEGHAKVKQSLNDVAIRPKSTEDF